MERERVTVSATEFARIVGVDHAAVFRALKNGVRLKNSIIKVNGKIRIAVCDGCVEWVSSKDERKDHRGGTTYDPVNGIMPREISSEMDRHYSALMKQIEYGRACGDLMPAAKYAEHARECLQTCRNTLMNLPLAVSELARPLLFEVVRQLIPADALTPELQKSMDDAVLQLRVTSQKEVRKALVQAADIIMDQYEKDRLVQDIRSN
ncbi:MAG: hypothetical protein M3Q07_15335 [Pseudobdellovibrionaceae bacterium]|nr:hypothetical protein [Pseudobdellovibrionaceae bacterium]